MLYRQLKAFVAQMRRGGAVIVQPIEASQPQMSGEFLRKIMIQFSHRGRHRKEVLSLTLQGFEITSGLDLRGCGIEGAPLMGLSLVDCTVRDGLNLEYAYLKALTIRGNVDRRAKIGSIHGRGLTVVDFLKLADLCMEEGSEIDLQESRLRSGIEMKGVAGATEGRGLTRVSFARSIVGSDMCIEGMHVNATEGSRSLDAEELTLAGSLILSCLSATGEANPLPCDLIGELNLQRATIGGALECWGLQLNSEAGGKNIRAFQAAGSRVGGDLTLKYYGTPANAVRCSITGTLDLTGMTVGGDVRLYGTFVTTQHIRVLRGKRMKIHGDLRFGHDPGRSSELENHACSVHGECDFSGAEIGGKAIFSGTTHSITRNFTCKNTQTQKQALHFRGATIGSELWLESLFLEKDHPEKGECCIEGLTLIGCKIGGRFLVHGARLSAPETTGTRAKAISANGATIHGGILMTSRQGDLKDKKVSNDWLPSRINGGFRLRNAIVDGPVELKSIDLQADPSGYALWASNTQFGSDVIIAPIEGGAQGCPKPIIKGELNFQGARVRGKLWVQGVHLTGSERTGIALDCFTAEIDRSLTLGSYCADRTNPSQGRKPGVHELETSCALPAAQASAVAADVTGLVSLVHLKAQSVTIGANPIARIEDEDDRLTLTGAVLMRDARLQSTVFFANALLRPVATLEPMDSLLAPMRKRLKMWGIYRSHCIVHANYSVLGTRLFVRLLAGSQGLISLYAAKTGTIGALTGDQLDDGEGERRGGGTQITGGLGTVGYWLRTAQRRSQLWLQWIFDIGFNGEQTVNDPRRENWGPPLTKVTHEIRSSPRRSSDAKEDVLLNLDEFTYDRTNDYREGRLRHELSFWKFYYWAIGRPSPDKLSPRFGWLSRTVENPSAQDPAVISAHRQLARVYRDMGRIKVSYLFIRERRWLQIHKDRWSFQSFIDRLYSLGFGFGYSPKRAVGSLLCLFLCSFLFVAEALHSTAGCIPYNTGCSATRNVMTTLYSKINDPHQPAFPSTCDPGTASCAPPLPSRVVIVPPEYEVTAQGQICRGWLCEPDKAQTVSSFHLPTSRLSWNTITESAKVVLPLPHLGEKSTVVLRNDAPLRFRIWQECLSLASWILFPLAIGTLTGVLRENP